MKFCAKIAFAFIKIFFLLKEAFFILKKKEMDIQNEKSILTNFVKNLEEKLSSVKLIHEQLFQLINLLSKTNQNILEDLTNIKQILNQNQ